ncbi:MAG TPA: hypothetical protein VK832_18150 [Burkholderiaceae bacterium]|jgi:hypothetical protein|nr:hypothetical protein [Burkholderiaceae bacterium]
MENSSLMQQIRRNLLALLSLLVALSALSYNTWRNEASEKHRNIRAAEFEMLKELSELQQIIDYAYLRQDPQHGDLAKGLAHVLFIHDLASLTPEPVNNSAQALLLSWNSDSEKLVSSKEAGATLSEQVLNTRTIVLESLRSLK